MPETNAHFEPVAWWYTRKKIGRGLAQHYELADDLPPRLLALISEIGGKPKTSAQGSSADKPGAIPTSVHDKTPSTDVGSGLMALLVHLAFKLSQLRSVSVLIPADQESAKRR